MNVKKTWRLKTMADVQTDVDMELIRHVSEVAEELPADDPGRAACDRLIAMAVQPGKFCHCMPAYELGYLRGRLDQLRIEAIRQHNQNLAAAVLCILVSDWLHKGNGGHKTHEVHDEW